MKYYRWALFSLMLLSQMIYAENIHCSFKVINHTKPSFQILQTKGTIYNLLIPTCIENPARLSDPFVKENCAQDARQTLFQHPKNPSTCLATNGWHVMIQFQTSSKVCQSKLPQQTIDKDIILHFPEDFDCS